jgi:hypothetical protein
MKYLRKTEKKIANMKNAMKRAASATLTDEYRIKERDRKGRQHAAKKTTPSSNLSTPEKPMYQEL